jgi:hypothetical protein
VHTTVEDDGALMVHLGGDVAVLGCARRDGYGVWLPFGAEPQRRRPFFPALGERIERDLVEQRTFGSRMVYLRYRRL